MNWLTVTTLMGGSASLMLGLVHFIIWIMDRRRWAHLLFVLTTIFIAAVAVGEVGLMLSETPGEFALRLRWIHVPFTCAVISLVWFVKFYCQAGRLWLACLACATRAFALLMNFLLQPNLNFREIRALEQVGLWGGGSVNVPRGVQSPWALISEISSLILLVFLADVAVTLWRRSEPAQRRRSMVTGISVSVFAVLGCARVAMFHAGLLHIPYFVSFLFLIPAAAMGVELAVELLKSQRLAQELDKSRMELIESEEKIDLAAKAAGFAIWKWDISSDSLWMSQNGRRLFGLVDSEPLTLNSFLDQVEAPDGGSFIDAAVRSANGKDGNGSEFRVRLPEGRTAWFAARGRTEFNELHEPQRVHGVFLDITAKRETENAIRRSEAYFRELANAAPVMIWMAGKDKLCTFCNRVWLEFTGRTMDQELGEGWLQSVHPEDRAGCMETYFNAFDARREFSMEYRLRNAAGEYRWVLDTGAPRFDEDADLLGYVGSAIDISDRKRAEEQLQQIVQLSPNGLLLVNPAGHIAFANAKVEALFGYSHDQLVGHQLDMLIPERFRPAHARKYAEYRARPEASHLGTYREFAAKRSDGSEVAVEIGLTPIRTPEGTSILVSMVDITQRRIIEREHSRQRKELAHLSRVAMLGELSGSFAHELNQPLTSILSNAQAAQKFLAQGDAGIAEVRAILDDIVQENRRASEVIHRLRRLFKNGEVLYEPIDLNAMVREVLGLMNSDLVNHDIAVYTELADTSPTVHGDRVQLQQVLINLVLNASDAMGGTEISGRRLMVTTQVLEDSAVELRVKDTGCGLSQDALLQIFEPFYTTKPHGMGLGLAICRTIVSAHGGRLWCSNNPDRGACFYLTFSALKEVSP